MDFIALSNLLQSFPSSDIDEVTIKIKSTDRILTDVVTYHTFNMREAQQFTSLDLRVDLEGLTLTFKPNPNPPQPEEGQGVEEAPAQLE